MAVAALSTQMQQVAPCPRCGRAEGWYEKRVCKYLQFFEVTGEPWDASSMERISGGSVRYCTGCHKDITSQVQPVQMGATMRCAADSMEAH